MSKVVILKVPEELLLLIHQAMRDEGIVVTHENVHSWMIGALTFTAAACSTPGYQAICDAYAAVNAPKPEFPTESYPPPPRRKYPPSDS